MHYLHGYGMPGMLIASLIFLIPLILFLVTLQKALERCAPESRTITPSSVWLLLIPLFNLVWMFIVVIKISESLGNEFRRRKILKEASPGQAIGIICCALLIAGILPIVGILTSIAFFVCWIVYWVKIAGYSAELAVPYILQD